MSEELFPDHEAETVLVSRLLGCSQGLSPTTVEAIESLCEEGALPASLTRRLDALGRAAEADLEYQATLEGSRRPATLGGYLLFLRKRLGLDQRAAAAKARISPQVVGDLERDGLSPVLVAAPGLIRLLKSLGASLEMSQQLLGTLVRAPAQVPAPAGGGRLFRSGGSGIRPTPRSQQRSAAASRRAHGEEEAWIDNPDYQTEQEAVTQLRLAIRAGW